MRTELGVVVTFISMLGGLNIFLYWIFCIMKTPPHQWEFVFDGTIIVVLFALNLFFVPIAKAFCSYCQSLE